MTSAIFGALWLRSTTFRADPLRSLVILVINTQEVHPEYKPLKQLYFGHYCLEPAVRASGSLNAPEVLEQHETETRVGRRPDLTCLFARGRFAFAQFHRWDKTVAQSRNTVR